MQTNLDEDIKVFLQSKDICLIGFMGSGKTFLGEFLAKELNLKLIETDSLIEEREMKTIPEIFKEKGEKYFRTIEKKVLQDLVFSDNDEVRIISTGGGLPIKRANQKLLKILNCLIICLNPPFETVLSRIRGTKRPLVYRKSRQSIFNLWSMRYYEYQRIASITVSETSLENIVRSLNQRTRIYMSSRSENEQI